MSGTRSTTVPVWLKAVVWSLAIGLAALGIVLAIVSGSLWPLLAFGGLAVPLLPIGTLRTTRTRAG